MHKTFMARGQDIERRWYLVDARDKVLGRLATQIACILRGKHKPIYTPHLDVGDNVVVINAKYIKVTGKKLKSKIYQHYSGYPGGLRKIPLEEMLKKNPAQIIRLAVKRMLPLNPLGRRMLKKLRVYKDDKYAQAAQKPVKLEV